MKKGQKNYLLSFLAILILVFFNYFTACDLQIIPGEGDVVVISEVEKNEIQEVQENKNEEAEEKENPVEENADEIKSENETSVDVLVEELEKEPLEETPIAEPETEAVEENNSDNQSELEDFDNSEEKSDEPQEEIEEPEVSEEQEPEESIGQEEENNQTEIEGTESEGTESEETPFIDEPVIEELEVSERQWSILVYMAADNNLEASAIEDFAEMELSTLNTERVSVFVLFDRSAGYDITNGDWSGTRLYQLKTGKQISSKFIISEEIDCRDLGLTAGVETELDMSSGYVLADSLAYVRKRYPANNYGLIMWGHGTGWRSETPECNGEELEGAPGGFKGFAFDESSKTYMTLKQMGEAIKSGMYGEKLDFLGFDTCFGMELEVLYELKDYVRYVAGSEGLLMTSGWNYTDFFNSIEQDSEKSAVSISTLLGKCFATWYSHSNGATFAVADMSSLSEYFNSFNYFMKRAAKNITNRNVRDEVMDIVFSGEKCRTTNYSYGATNSDVYLDVRSCVSELQDYFCSLGIEIGNKDFKQAESQLLSFQWSSNGTGGGIGVYFQSLSAGQLLAALHPAAYIRGKTISQISFVEKCDGYVPNVAGECSFLERLFYEKF